jgi:hypothetical protein
MRPTVEEQLQGTCKILETVVAPCVADPYARTILDNLIANLRMLTIALPKVGGFMRQDNHATQSLLETLRAALSAELVARIDHAIGIHEPAVDNELAIDERNRLLRSLLADAVCSKDLTPEMRQSIESYMVNRASRVPMRYVPTVASVASPNTSTTTK